MKNVKAEKLEDQVVSYTMQYVLQDDVIAELVNKLLEYQSQQQDNGMLERCVQSWQMCRGDWTI